MAKKAPAPNLLLVEILGIFFSLHTSYTFLWDLKLRNFNIVVFKIISFELFVFVFKVGSLNGNHVPDSFRELEFINNLTTWPPREKNLNKALPFKGFDFYFQSFTYTRFTW